MACFRTSSRSANRLLWHMALEDAEKVHLACLLRKSSLAEAQYWGVSEREVQLALLERPYGYYPGSLHLS